MSAFNCKIKFNVVEGNSFTTTYNKLVSQGFIDKYMNVKVDVGLWRRGRSEINAEASQILRREVNMFTEKKLLNGIRVIPNMKEFGIIDAYNREAKENTRKRMLVDAQKRVQFESENLLTEEVGYGEIDSVDEIYDQLDLRPGAFISSEQTTEAQQIITRYNKQDAVKTLSLRKIAENKYLINTTYNSNYLSRPNDYAALEDKTEMFKETDSNNNFNLGCIR